jgi:hypothetical protein
VGSRLSATYEFFRVLSYLSIPPGQSSSRQAGESAPTNRKMGFCDRATAKFAVACSFRAQCSILLFPVETCGLWVWMDCRSIEAARLVGCNLPATLAPQEHHDPMLRPGLVCRAFSAMSPLDSRTRLKTKAMFGALPDAELRNDSTTTHATTNSGHFYMSLYGGVQRKIRRHAGVL